MAARPPAPQEYLSLRCLASALALEHPVSSIDLWRDALAWAVELRSGALDDRPLPALLSLPRGRPLRRDIPTIASEVAAYAETYGGPSAGDTVGRITSELPWINDRLGTEPCRTSLYLNDTPVLVDHLKGVAWEVTSVADLPTCSPFWCDSRSPDPGRHLKARTVPDAVLRGEDGVPGHNRIATFVDGTGLLTPHSLDAPPQILVYLLGRSGLLVDRNVCPLGVDEVPALDLAALEDGWFPTESVFQAQLFSLEALWTRARLPGPLLGPRQWVEEYQGMIWGFTSGIAHAAPNPEPGDHWTACPRVFPVSSPDGVAGSVLVDEPRENALDPAMGAAAFLLRTQFVAPSPEAYYATNNATFMSGTLFSAETEEGPSDYFLPAQFLPRPLKGHARDLVSRLSDAHVIGLLGGHLALGFGRKDLALYGTRCPDEITGAWVALRHPELLTDPTLPEGSPFRVTDSEPVPGWDALLEKLQDAFHDIDQAYPDFDDNFIERTRFVERLLQALDPETLQDMRAGLITVLEDLLSDPQAMDDQIWALFNYGGFFQGEAVLPSAWAPALWPWAALPSEALVTGIPERDVDLAASSPGSGNRS